MCEMVQIAPTRRTASFGAHACATRGAGFYLRLQRQAARSSVRAAAGSTRPGGERRRAGGDDLSTWESPLATAEGRVHDGLLSQRPAVHGRVAESFILKLSDRACIFFRRATRHAVPCPETKHDSRRADSICRVGHVGTESTEVDGDGKARPREFLVFALTSIYLDRCSHSLTCCTAFASVF